MLPVQKFVPVATAVHDKFPAPSLVKTWPVVPVVFGNVYSVVPAPLPTHKVQFMVKVPVVAPNSP